MDVPAPRPLPRATRPPVFARTKFLAPQPRDTLVLRQRLRDTLQQADALPLTIVVGAPGSGKTSLLAEWYRHVDDGSVAWLSADRGDGDPTRFWHAFIAAVQQLDASFGREAADLMTLDGHVSADVMESLLNDDLALNERLRLVIDDFHLVSLDAAQQLQHLLGRGLKHVRLLVGSRSDPAVGLHLLRLEGQVAEVREADLRLSLHETAALLAALGVAPDSVDVEALHHRTEGWAAGVQMASLSVRGSDDAASRVRELAGTTQTVAGYLASEVVANQSLRIQDFLERTCVVDELDDELAAALSPDDLSGDDQRVTLAEVEAANLMLTRIDAAGTYFRYHQLFAEMLRNRLQARDPDRHREQHRRAAEHYLASGNASSAVRHYWSAGERSRGAQLIREQMVRVYLGSETPTPPGHVATPVDDEHLHDSPADAVGYASAMMMNGQMTGAAELLERAELVAVAQGAPPLDLIHIAAGQIGAHLIAGDATRSVASATRFMELLRTHGVPTDDDWSSTAVPWGIRAAVWEGDLDLADQLVREMPRHHDQRLIVVDNASAVAILELERGEVDQALEHASAAHVVASDLDAAGSTADSAAQILMGAALLEQARIVEAAAHLRAGFANSRTERVPTRVMVAIGEARILRSNGQFDAAFAKLAALRTQLRITSPGPTFIARLDHAEVAIRLAVGDYAKAASLLDGVPAGFRTTLASAWVAHLQHQSGEADRFRAALDHHVGSRRERLDLAIYDLRIALDRSIGTVDAAAEAVLDLAEAGGAMLPIPEAGGTVLHAVAQAARRRPRSAYINRLLALQPLPRPAEQARPRHQMDELSNRELIVLRYMVTSMTNQEIADALYLSVNTVKTHIKHVLRKLDATSRADAATRAHELHYL